MDHFEKQRYQIYGRREARVSMCLQERISTCKAMFPILQAKEMQQMVKLEAEMDRRPATVVWNSKMQIEAAKLHSIKRSPPNFSTQIPCKKAVVFCVSFMYRHYLKPQRLTYFYLTFRHWISLANQKYLQVHKNCYSSKAEFSHWYYNLNMFATKYHHKSVSLALTTLLCGALGHVWAAVKNSALAII